MSATWSDAGDCSRHLRRFSTVGRAALLGVGAPDPMLVASPADPVRSRWRRLLARLTAFFVGRHG